MSTPRLILAGLELKGVVEKPRLILSDVAMPLTIEELDTYVVFRTFSEIPPTAVQIPVSAEQLVIVKSGGFTLTVCGVSFDEAVLTIDGLGSFTAKVEGYEHSCRLVYFEITPSSYKCGLDKLSRGECVSFSGCTDIPWPGLVYVDTENSWYAVRAGVAYGVVSSGKAYTYADYICVDGSATVCKVGYPSDCCEARGAKLFLKYQGSIVAYSEFTLSVCTFG